MQTEVVVIGAGPGGYAAAFQAADKGKKVLLVERAARLGGVCLHEGCIPSKALLQATGLIEAAQVSGLRGIRFQPPTIELDKLRAWKNSLLQKLAQGIAFLAQKRGVQVLQGAAQFEGPRQLQVQTGAGPVSVEFEHAVIATGSRPVLPPAFNIGSPRVITSSQALVLEEIPSSLLVIGGGYIGMELGTVYAALGSRVVVIEALDSILTGTDPDLVRPVLAKAKKAFQEVRLGTKVASLFADGSQIGVVTQSAGNERTDLFDRVLVAVGRAPNSGGLQLDRADVTCDGSGFIETNRAQQTKNPAIFAIGDVTVGPMLAHKAVRDARVAIDAIMGETGPRPGGVIPAVVFTHPEIAWCGLTETEAKRIGRAIEVARFPWGASGRAVTMDGTDGLTKLVIDPATEQILGVGIVGTGAGELIAEGVLAIEMGATAKQLGRVVHPHPTLSETLMECAEAFYGIATHIHSPRARKGMTGGTSSASPMSS